MKSRFLNIGDQFREAWTYLAKSRYYVFAVALIFLIFALVGYTFYSQFGFLDVILRNLINMTKDMKGFELIAFILQNNLQSAFIGMIFGVIFGIFSIVTAGSNGLILGYVLARTREIAGFQEFWRVLPHGVFELPAIFISLGLGLKLGFSFFSAKGLRDFKNRVYNSINVFLFIVVPLLIVAAIIEGLLIVLLR